MERLLQNFDAPFTARNGDVYDVQLYGRVRPGDTWQAWLVFARRLDHQSFATDIESTQPSEAAVLYWATGLSVTYFEGALERAQRRSRHPSVRADDDPHLEELTSLEHAILRSFSRHATTQLSTELLFRDLPHSSADVIRAVKDLQNKRRLIVRRTEAGQDWLFLTDQGVRARSIADSAESGTKIST